MNIGEEADKYEPSRVKNISELASVPLTAEVQEETDVEYPYKYILVNGERYKLPQSVLASIKELKAANPNLKNFKVKKTGDGIKVKYLVIPLA